MFQLNKKILLAFIVSFCTSPLLKAQISFNPFIGYSQTSIKFVDPLPSTDETTIKSNAPVVGLGMGYISPRGAFLGLNGSYLKGTGKMKNSTGVEIKQNLNHLTGSVQLGLIVSGTVKIYLGYLLKNDLKISNREIPGGKYKFTGTGYQAGLEFFLARRTALVLNYDLHQFNEVKDEDTNVITKIKDMSSKFDSQAMAAHLKFYF